MPKQLPNVANDKGYQEDAKSFAIDLMSYKNGLIFPPKSIFEIQEWIENALQKAYLRGAQSAVSVGYHLAEKDYEEVIRYYKKQISELQQGGEQ